jgi:hypothetical protein
MAGASTDRRAFAALSRVICRLKLHAPAARRRPGGAVPRLVGRGAAVILTAVILAGGCAIRIDESHYSPANRANST